MLTLSQVGQLLGAGTIGGFVAGEITRRLSARQERRGHFGKAMADLLEVRYGLLAIEAIREDLTKLTGSADMIGPQLHIIANVFLPNWNELHSRYDLAVS